MWNDLLGQFCRTNLRHCPHGHQTPWSPTPRPVTGPRGPEQDGRACLSCDRNTADHLPSLSCLRAPASPHHRAKLQPRAVPAVHALPMQGQHLSAPSVLGGTRLLLWALATLPSCTWALMHALSVPSAPMYPLSSASAQVFLPPEPCLLAAHCSESKGLHPPRFLAMATAPLALCSGLTASPLEKSRVHPCLRSLCPQGPQHTAGSMEGTR